MRQAQLASGEVLEFPDETPDEVMDATVKRHLQGNAAPAPPPVELPPDYQKMADFGMGHALQVSRAAATPKPPPDRVGENVTAVNKAIYGTMGLGPDIIAGALRAVAGANPNTTPIFGGIIRGMQAMGLDKLPEPIGGSASIQRGAEKIGVPTVEPVDRQGRITTRIVEELTSALFPTAGLATKARALRVAGKAPDSQSIVRPFVDAPIREPVNQMGLAAAAGTGAAGAREVFGDSPAADISGALFGSMAGSNMARGARTVATAVGDVANPKRVAREGVSDILAKSMTDKRVDAEGRTLRVGDEAFSNRLDDARALEKDVPGLKLTTGEATTDPGLQALEYQRRQQNVGPYENQRQGNRQAVNTALDETAPKAANDAATRAALEKRRTGALEAAAEAEAKRTNQVEDARQAADPGMTRQGAGETIRSEIGAEKAKARMEERDLWRSIDPENKSQIDTTNVRDRARALLDETPRTEAPTDTPPLVRDLAGKTEKPELTGRSIDPELEAEAAKTADKSLLRDKETAAELLSLKSRLTDEIRTARANEESPNRIRKLSVMLDEVMTSLERGDPGRPDVQDKFKAATAASRELNDRFTRGTAADVTAVDSRGAKKVEDSELAGKFFKGGPNGSVEALEDFERAVGGSAKAKKALRAYALDDARRAAVGEDGRVDAKKLEKWVAGHKDALDRYPDIRDDLGNLGSAQKSLERASRRRELLDESLTNPKKSTIGKYLDRDDARDSMDAILRSKNPKAEAANLARTIKGDADALEGARRAFWDRMMEGTSANPKSGIKATADDAAGTPVIKAAGFKEFMAKNGDVAKALFEPEHLKRLERIAEAVEAGQRTTKIKVPGTSGTGQTIGVPGLTLAGMTSRGYAIARGVVSLPYVVLETGARAGRRAYMKVKVEEVNKLLDEALTNPDVAKTLVMEWNANNQKVIARRLKTHLGHELQIGAEEAAEPDEK